MQCRAVALLVALFVCFSTLLLAAPPTLPVQGLLRSGAGIAVDGEYQFLVSLYADQDALVLLWQEEQTVTVAGGAFEFHLGQSSTLDAALISENQELWVGVIVDGEPELPKRKIGFVAKALYATNAGTAFGLQCSGCINTEMLSSTAQLELGNGPISTIQESSFGQSPAVAGATITGFNYKSDTWTIDVPALGTSTQFAVSVDLSHPDVGELEIWLTPPEGKGQKVKLHDKSLAGTTQLVHTWPTDGAPASGDLSQFEGIDISGTWTLEIFDGVSPAQGGTAEDGTLNHWSIDYHHESDLVTADGKLLATQGIVDAYVAGVDFDTQGTPPMAVYINKNGTVYPADTSGNAWKILWFVGYAVSGQKVDAGQSVLVQSRGVLDGFSWLQPGALYYLGPKPDTVVSDAEYVSKLVGRAVGETRLQLLSTPDTVAYEALTLGLPKPYQVWLSKEKILYKFEPSTHTKIESWEFTVQKLSAKGCEFRYRLYVTGEGLVVDDTITKTSGTYTIKVPLSISLEPGDSINVEAHFQNNVNPVNQPCDKHDFGKGKFLEHKLNGKVLRINKGLQYQAPSYDLFPEPTP